MQFIPPRGFVGRKLVAVGARGYRIRYITRPRHPVRGRARLPSACGRSWGISSVRTGVAISPSVGRGQSIRAAVYGGRGFAVAEATRCETSRWECASDAWHAARGCAINAASNSRLPVVSSPRSVAPRRLSSVFYCSRPCVWSSPPSRRRGDPAIAGWHRPRNGSTSVAAPRFAAALATARPDSSRAARWLPSRCPEASPASDREMLRNYRSVHSR